MGFGIREKVKRIWNNILPLDKRDRVKLGTIEKSFPSVMSTEMTLNTVISQHRSLCRFGDAEFDICLRMDRDDPYQRPSEALTSRLLEVLRSSEPNVLVCIPPFCSKTNNLVQFRRRVSFWEYYWLRRWDLIGSLLAGRSYGNSFVSRDSVFHENSVDSIRKLWEGRDVVFVVGRNGRFKYDERLFGGIRSRRAVFVSPTDAFGEYERILDECCQFELTSLFLIAAGPTATVLAFDLAEKGFQALDIGHITNCFLQFLGESDAPEALPLITSGTDYGVPT